MKPIDPSKYRRPITVQQRSGGSWVEVFGHTLMAAITPKGSSLENPMLRSHQVEVRWRSTPELVEGMRITDSARYLYIRSVIDVDEAHQEWQIKAYELRLDLTADIQRNQSVTISLGQLTEDWQTILDDGPVPCAMTQPNNALRQEYASTIAAQQVAVFTFAEGQTVQPNDRVIAQNTTWTVHSLLAPQSYTYATQVLAARMG